MSARRVELAVATGAALTAYAVSLLPPSRTGLRWVGGIGAAALAAGAIAIRPPAVPPRVLRWTSLGLRLLLVAVGSIVVFSRQVPLLRYDGARLAGAIVGATLAILALVLLAGRESWPVHSGLVPALAGVLAVAGMEHGTPWFVPLASAAGLAAWVDALRTGGPRRFGWPLAACAVAGAALAAGIAWFLPVAQPHVQEMVARAYGEGRTGLSDRSELGDVASLALSRRVVARVWTDRPQLLRMQVFSQFDGRRWVAFPRDGRPLLHVDRPRLGPLLAAVPGAVYAGSSLPFDHAGLSETRVLPDLWTDDGWGLLAPSGPLLLVWPEEGLALDDRGLVTTSGAAAKLYGVANRPLAGAAAGPTRTDLAPPVRIDPRVRALAASLQAGERPGPALVERTLEHLRRHYRYTLDVGRFETTDPLAEFLFDKRAGYCEYFATAAVVLLRLQGVPARYVKGASVRPESRVGGHYVVRESDAHAWVDVWSAGTGWTEVDPTPSGGWALTHPEQPPSAFEQMWERVSTFTAQAWARWRQGGWRSLTGGLSRAAGEAWRFASAHRLALAVLALATVAAIALGRARPKARRDDPRPRAVIEPELAALLQRIERSWARTGNERPPARGLVEHLEAMPSHALSADDRVLSERVVRAVYESAFAGRSPAPGDLEALAAEARSLPR